jgi:hypothetical protein
LSCAAAGSDATNKTPSSNPIVRIMRISSSLIFYRCRGISGLADVSRIFVPQASRWEIWRRSIGLVVGRTGGSLSSSGQKDSNAFPAMLSATAFPV